MKKKILVAGFFTILMLLMPIASAFNMPLTKKDKDELEFIIENEPSHIQEFFGDLINEDGSLNIDEVERIYEEYIFTGDATFINSDPWEWIINRLGWIYITIQEVTELYNAGMSLYYKIIQGVQAVQNFFNSIQGMRSAWQAFKANPLNFQTIVDLIYAVIDLVEAALAVIEYAMSGAIGQLIEAFANETQGFVDFLQSSPWLQPISIRGNIIGFDQSLTISVPGDSQTQGSYYNLSYATTGTSLPWFVHKVDIKGEYKGKTTTKSRYAFSMGIIEEDWEKGDFKTISKTAFPRLQILLERFQMFFAGILQNLNIKLPNYRWI